MNGKKRILICGVNWLGDSIMSMPAIQLLRRTRPDCHVSLLVKEGQAPLWRMHRGVDEVLTFHGTAADTWGTARNIKALAFDTAFVFPNSFRSALIPFLARIHERVGARGDHRAWLLTRTVAEPASGSPEHQSLEYIRILGLGNGEAPLGRPELHVPESAQARGIELTGSDPKVRWFGVIPGAAHGPSKRWPAAHFAETGRRVCRESGCRALVMGTLVETPLCAEVASGIGAPAMNVAGRTALPELAALLQRCDAVLTNDNGGMHLASAVGVPVVAVFGMTDPERTGPMGDGHVVACAAGVARSRNIAAKSAAAEASLRSIEPDRIAADVLGVLARTPGSRP